MTWLSYAQPDFTPYQTRLPLWNKIYTQTKIFKGLSTTSNSSCKFRMGRIITKTWALVSQLSQPTLMLILPPLWLQSWHFYHHAIHLTAVELLLLLPLLIAVVVVLVSFIMAGMSRTRRLRTIIFVTIMFLYEVQFSCRIIEWSIHCFTCICLRRIVFDNKL